MEGVPEPVLDETKSFLYAWLSKNKVLPEYSVRPTGPKNRQRFLCELSVIGFPYRAAGNSTSKKDAQTNAAKDFLQFLIRSKNIDPGDIPPNVLAFTPSAPESLMNFDCGRQDRPVFRSGMGPRDMGETYRPYGARPDFDEINAKNLADAEDLDVNAGLHGNWTIENAKSRLHQFFQMHKIQTEYKYQSVGPPHAKSFQAELSTYIKQLGRVIQARETGSNKQTASKSCALSMIRQLYHLRVIEPFAGTLKRPKESNSIKPYQVCVDPAVMTEVHSVLSHLGIQPVDTTSIEQALSGFKNSIATSELRGVIVTRGASMDVLTIRSLNIAVPMDEHPEQEGAETEQIHGKNLIPETTKDFLKIEDHSAVSMAGIVSFSPPQPNWNPWTSCNIDEGHMASTSLEQLSLEFLESFKEVQQTNKKVQDIYAVRSTLPVFQSKSAIMEAITEYPVILIKGDTGCGKTTQVCQFILDDWLQSEQGAFCNVVITQPRRISAISVAERVATERGEELGQSVGYSVRFESCLPRPYASILFCTVGVLLRKLEAGLRGVSHVIVDEIHERDINSDFLLVILRDMLSVYPDLRVILMSATIDETLFTQYFNGCPAINVEGRTFPVQTYFLEEIVEELQFVPNPASLRQGVGKRLESPHDYVRNTLSEKYRPMPFCPALSKGTNRNNKKPAKDEEDTMEGVVEENLNILRDARYSEQTRHAMSLLNERDINWDLLTTLLKHIKTLPVKGAVLIFLPGWNVIFSVLRYLQTHPVFGSSSYCLLPLHSQLPREDQHRVFEKFPGNVTKIILSTNIAETSLTIDDVVYVIDSCKAKTKLFTSHNNMTTYVTMWASKSNLMQRRGRAGRVQNGYCYHLCSKSRFEKLDESMTPEIFRTPLHEISLAIKLLRLGGIAQFLSKAPEPPPLDAVIEAQALLYDINCLDNTGELTPLGRILAKLPLDPRLGKMIVLGSVFGCADPLAIIAANSSNMSEVFNLGPENKRLAPEQRAFAAHRHSDHFAMLNAFQQWLHLRERRGEEAEFEFCQQRLCSLPSLRMTCDAKNQLLQVLSQCDFPEDNLSTLFLHFRQSGQGSPALDTIAGLLCAGFYPNICFHMEKRKVLTTESKMALVHKASVNCTKFDTYFPYPFFVFGEKIRTRAVSCKQMTVVSPIHLLLFASKKAELTGGLVRLDNWINLQMNPADASAIVALRPAIENLVLKVSENPEGFFPLSADDERLVSLVVSLCRMNCAKFGLDAEDNESQFRNFQSGGFPEDHDLPDGEGIEGYEECDYESEGYTTQGDGHFGGNRQDEFDANNQTGQRGVKRTYDVDYSNPNTETGDQEKVFEEGNEEFRKETGRPPIPKRLSQGNEEDSGFNNPGRSVPRFGAQSRGSDGRDGGFNSRGGGRFGVRLGNFSQRGDFNSRGGFSNSRGDSRYYSRGASGSFNSSVRPTNYTPSPRVSSRGFSRGFSPSPGSTNFTPLGSPSSFSPRGRGNFTSRGSSGNDGNNSGFGQHRPRFFSSNRGGWSARGNSGGSRGFNSGGGGRGYSRPRQNYPY